MYKYFVKYVVYCVEKKFDGELIIWIDFLFFRIFLFYFLALEPFRLKN